MKKTQFLVILLTFMPLTSFAFGVGLVPLHSFQQQVDKDYGKNISLHGTPQQIEKLRKWIDQIAQVPKGHNTLVQIQNSGHKLFIFHSTFSMVSSGRTSAPATDRLINGEGDSVDIHFNADIPDRGSHRVLGNKKVPIEFTAVQNLYHELAHALHMMSGSWRYFNSERQAIEEENIFRAQLAEQQQKPFVERVYTSGLPICPESTEDIDYSWAQEIICK